MRNAMTSNSTTPDSPKCPECGSDNKGVRKYYNEARHEWTFANFGRICLDPFHTSLPTAEPIDNDQCTDCDNAARYAYSDATTPGFFSPKCEKHRELAKAAHPSETRAGERLPISSCCSAPIAEDDGYGFCTKCNQRLYARVGEQEAALDIQVLRNAIIRSGAQVARSRFVPYATADALHKLLEKALNGAAPVQTGEGSTMNEPTVESAQRLLRDLELSTSQESRLELLRDFCGKVRNFIVEKAGGGSTGPDTPTLSEDQLAEKLAFDIEYFLKWKKSVSWLVTTLMAWYKPQLAAASVQGEGINQDLHIELAGQKALTSQYMMWLEQAKSDVAALTAKIERLREGWTKCIGEKFDLASQLAAAQQELAVQNASLTSATALICGHVDRAEAAETLVGELRTQLKAEKEVTKEFRNRLNMALEGEGPC